MKYKIVCKKCGHVIESFAKWFEADQLCPECGSNHAEIEYSVDYSKLPEYFSGNPESFWHYFDFLPLNDKSNIVSCGEGAIPMEHWEFLDKYAKDKYGIDCKAYIYRNDLNGGTNTFKDVAASMAASLFKENGIEEYCLASSGNTATAYSKYLAKGGIKFDIFVPETTFPDTIEEIRSWKQNLVVCDGDYGAAKKVAADFHKEQKVLISAGNIDPIRVEAKRTMVFEFLRQLGQMPDVYIQAVAGGTGPIAIDKGVREISPYFPEVKLPRMILVQQDTCDPMVQGWERAVANNFAEGYEKDYPVIPNPQTKVSILSAGNPGMYPLVAPMVRKSDGYFVRVKESELVDYAKIAKNEKNVNFGPAGAVCFAGFFQALAEGRIRNGELVLINVGEGSDRAKAFKEAVNR
ncbi:MAG: pyridoxal-phosphate dependent enzyme [Bacteroidales bacterium]|nr:pyridoxal-phosphate dependent enzyme [Bacteroidales bacterium]